MSLVLEYNYPREQIEVEYKIKVGSGTKRVDLALFAPGVPHTQDNVHTIIETKREGTKREDRADGVGQMKSYMAACLNCQNGMWTNGVDRECSFKNTDRGEFVFIDAIDIPVQGARKADAPSWNGVQAVTCIASCLGTGLTPDLCT